MYMLKRIFFIAAIIGILCGCGKNNSDEMREYRGQREVLSHETEVEEAEEPHGTPFAVYYDIKLEGDTVTMYEVNSEGPDAVKSIEICASYYPAEDIQALKQGITAYSKEGAYEILENFAN